MDNAITSARQNEAQLVKLDPEYHLEIDIAFDEGAGTIEIRDNAAGITKADLPRALRTASPPADLRFLSIYGVGMKAAGLWWANTLTIETKALDERLRRTVTIDTRGLDRPGGGSVDVTERPAPTNQHGTVIRLSNLTKNLPEGRTLGKVRAYLASMYRNFLLDGGNTTIRVKGEDLVFEYPKMLEAPVWPSTAGPKRGARPLTWETRAEIKLATGEVVTGWVGLLAKGSTAGAGFLLTFHDKAIVGVGAGTAVGDEYYRPREIRQGAARQKTLRRSWRPMASSLAPVARSELLECNMRPPPCLRVSPTSTRWLRHLALGVRPAPESPTARPDRRGAGGGATRGTLPAGSRGLALLRLLGVGRRTPLRGDVGRERRPVCRLRSPR